MSLWIKTVVGEDVESSARGRQNLYNVISSLGVVHGTLCAGRRGTDVETLAMFSAAPLLSNLSILEKWKSVL